MSWWFLCVVKGERHPVCIENHDVVKIVSATVPVVFELLNFTTLYPGITLTTELNTICIKTNLNQIKRRFKVVFYYKTRVFLVVVRALPYFVQIPHFKYD